MCDECVKDPAFKDYVDGVVAEVYDKLGSNETEAMMLLAPLKVAQAMIRKRHGENNTVPEPTEEEAAQIIRLIAVLIKDVYGDGQGDSDEEMNEFAASFMKDSPPVGELVGQLESDFLENPEKYTEAISKFNRAFAEMSVHFDPMPHATSAMDVLSEPISEDEEHALLEAGTINDKLRVSVRHMASKHMLTTSLVEALAPNEYESMNDFMRTWASYYARAGMRRFDLSSVAVVTDEPRLYQFIASILATMSYEAWVAGYYAGSKGQECLIPTHDLPVVNRFLDNTDEDVEAVLERVRNFYSS